MIYSHRETERYYLIPEDAFLPLGKLKLVNLKGEERYVDESAVSAYVLTKEETHEWLKEKGKDVIGQVTVGIQSFLSALATDTLEDKPKTPDGKSTKVNLNFFADLMGEEPDDLLNDADARKRGWDTLIGGIAQVLENSASDDPERLDEARAVMHDVDELLQWYGVETKGWFKEFPSTFNQMPVNRQNKAGDTPPESSD